MEYEQTFRFILILGIAVIVPIGAYHRIKSQATGEKLDRRQEGIFILVTLRPIGIALPPLGVPLAPTGIPLAPTGAHWHPVGSHARPLGSRWRTLGSHWRPLGSP